MTVRVREESCAAVRAGRQKSEIAAIRTAVRQYNLMSEPPQRRGVNNVDAPVSRRRNSVPSVLDYDPATSWASATSDSAAGFFAGMVVIASTLTRIRAVPTMVRRASGSPPRKYPTSTATIGFTYAYVPTFVGDSW